MPAYTVRIQLTGKPDQETYDDLHSRMEEGGFLRTITGTNNRDLPHGTYYGASSMTVSEIKDWAKQQAKEAWARAQSLLPKLKTGRGVNPDVLNALRGENAIWNLMTSNTS